MEEGNGGGKGEMDQDLIIRVCVMDGSGGVPMVEGPRENKGQQSLGCPQRRRSKHP